MFHVNNIFRKTSLGLFEMAACFSSASVLSTPPVFVLSQTLPNLAESVQELSLPGISVKNVRFAGSMESPLTEEQIQSVSKAEIAVCDCFLLAKMYKYMPDLKWAHCTSAGVESLFKSIPEEPTFTVTRHGGNAFCSLMAEYVICQILNWERKSKLCWRSQESKTWLGPEDFMGHRSLDEMTVAILGVGNMASAIAGFLKPRGMTVLGYSRRPRLKSEFGIFDKISNNMDDILPMCDFLCNVLPSTSETSGLLTHSLLEKCQKKPVFINVGRGNIISESILVQALRNGLLSGAVLDVFEEEPLPKSSDLWEMEQVTITPHVSALSKPEHVAEEFFRLFSQYIDGHDLDNVVNWSAEY